MIGHTAIGTWSGGRFMHFGERLEDDRLVRLLTPGERLAEQAVGLAGAIDVGGDDGVDVVAGRDQGEQALLVELLAEVHEAPAAPGAERDVAGIAHGVRVAAARR